MRTSEGSQLRARQVEGMGTPALRALGPGLGGEGSPAEELGALSLGRGLGQSDPSSKEMSGVPALFRVQ